MSETEPSTLNPQPSTLNPQPSTLNPQPSTLNPQPSTLNPQPIAASLDLVGTCVSSSGASTTGCTNSTFSRSCNSTPCYPKAWLVGQWGACSKTCADSGGAGKQTRTVGCYQYTDSNTTTLVNAHSHIPQQHHHAGKRSCTHNTGKCSITHVTATPPHW